MKIETKEKTTSKIKKIGFGGGCHWCTEAIFSALKGVVNVEQGWIKSTAPHDTFSEAVIVHYNPEVITLQTLLEIHLNTHSSTSNHSMRVKYRSAAYYFSDEDFDALTYSLNYFKDEDGAMYITKILPFSDFKLNSENFLNYYEKNKDAPFCKTYITPKINKLRKEWVND